ncbi:hypothetical protein SISSUDRAFT_1124328 [Sistotremastrum suecicum HHB10207 ss-3]|uniref:Uncharacterized protein n=1 Tax=Sistotremastrum suecicum HHB10207 ss-3 TaxID=1314776 RepID=A0A166IY83_9AGAM|nr:hypothetical protein SISSUDRAFT_1124328 [Sistotremastrum suecicum HHB10207 ss-3]
MSWLVLLAWRTGVDVQMISQEAKIGPRRPLVGVHDSFTEPYTPEQCGLVASSTTSVQAAPPIVAAPPPGTLAPSDIVIASSPPATRVPAPATSTPSQPSNLPGMTSHFITFGEQSNGTICGALFLSWTWNVPSKQPSNQFVMEVDITNLGVSQMGLPAPAMIIEHVISSNVSVSDEGILWPKIEVPQGWYVVEGVMNGMSPAVPAQSPPFFIATGNNASCLEATATVTIIPSSSSSQEPSHPRQAHGLNTGALAAVVVSCCLGVIASILAFGLINRVKVREFLPRWIPGSTRPKDRSRYLF